MHFTVGLAAVTIGFYASLPLVLFLVILHRVHLVVFDGCVITRVQQYLGHFPRQVDFLEIVWKRFLKKDLTYLQTKVLDYSLGAAPILIAAVRFYS